MKTSLYLLLAALLCMGITGCEGGDDDSPATITTVTTNATTGVVQTNVVVVEDVAADVAEPAAEVEEDALGVPAVPTMTGKWLGVYTLDGVNALLSLSLEQNGEKVTGTCSFSDAGGGTIYSSGWLEADRLHLGMKRNGIICVLEGLVDFDARTYEGTWYDKVGNEGTFSLR